MSHREGNGRREAASAALAAVALTAAGGAAWVATRVHTSLPNQWLVKTGAGIATARVGKSYVRWPFQHVRVVAMDARTLRVTVAAMSSEKLAFLVPSVWTLGVADDAAAVAAFATRVPEGATARLWEEVVIAALEAETRTLAANMGVEQVFQGRAEFMAAVREKVAPVLAQFGLHVINAGVSELHDGEGSSYFTSLARTIDAQAKNKAEREVAAANKDGNIAKKEREAETRKAVAEQEAKAVDAEAAAKQQQLEAGARVAETAAATKLRADNARIAGEGASSKLFEERQRDVADVRLLRETAAERAKAMPGATSAAEAAVRRAEGERDAANKTADGALYAATKAADGALYAAQREAEAARAAGDAAAAAALAMLRARADGMAALVAACGGDVDAAVRSIALNDGTVERLVAANAAAVKGLNPQLTVWSSDGAGAVDPLRRLAGAVPPFLDALRDQTGINLAGLLAPPAAPAAEPARAAELR
jgi:flotillin